MLTPIRARDTIELPFPSDVVWPVLRDLTDYPRWWPPSLRLRVIGGGADGLGTELEVRPPASLAFRCRVEDLSEGRWIKLRYYGDQIQGSGLLRLEASGGGSRVTYELDVHARGWLVALLARFMDLASILSRQMREVLQNLTGCSKSPPAAFSHRSEAQRTEAYASPLRSLRPCWTAFLSILSLLWRQCCVGNIHSTFCA
jgi:Polyketide cyclase / dehydrase and lipid transport